MNFLEEIKKTLELKTGEPVVSLENRTRPLSLSAFIRQKNGLIGEFKRATPTKKFNPVLPPSEVARLYQRYGFSAVSVVVENRYFLTTEQDLADVRKAVEIPVLKKGFFLYEHQIIEARNQGADSVLLIVALLGRERLISLWEKCQELELEPVVEIHSLEEIETIADLPLSIVGINNRDLKSLTVDLAQGEAALRELKRRKIGELHIVESGLKEANDLRRFRQLGADGFLIGGCFMEAVDLTKKIEEITEGLTG